MDYFIDPGGERRNEDHNDGQSAGSNAGFFEQAAHEVFSILHTDDYNRGFDNGVDNPKEQRAELAERLSGILSRIESEEQEREETLAVLGRALARREEWLTELRAKCPNAAVTRQMQYQVQDFGNVYVQVASGSETASLLEELKVLCSSFPELVDQCEKELAKQSRRNWEPTGKAIAVAKANAERRNDDEDYYYEEE